MRDEVDTAFEHLQRGAASESDSELLYRRFHDPLRLFLIQRGVAREEAEDLVQETFLRFFKSAREFRGESSPRTWLFHIASNLMANSLRYKLSLKRNSAVSRAVLPDEETLLQVSDEAPDPEKLSIAREEGRIIAKSIESMPEGMRLCMVLFLRDYSILEISRILSIHEGTVKSQLHRARQIIKSQFERLQLRPKK